MKAGAQYHFRVTARNRYGWSHSVQTTNPVTVGEFANEHGSVSCHCSLIVDKGIRAYIAPEFLGNLEPECIVKGGQEIRLCAQIEAYPTVGKCLDSFTFLSVSR